ncbi:hypothetical protein L7F22_063459 [Adiantum nelumboides]|nr:hypothetical protein [Adiantum nelumboides]
MAARMAEYSLRTGRGGSNTVKALSGLLLLLLLCNIFGVLAQQQQQQAAIAANSELASTDARNSATESAALAVEDTTAAVEACLSAIMSEYKTECSTDIASAIFEQFVAFTSSNLTTVFSSLYTVDLGEQTKH